MHAMMRRGVHDPFERPQPWCELGVDEELIEEIDTQHCDNRNGVEADPCEGKEEQEMTGDTTGPAEPDRRSEVQLGR